MRSARNIGLTCRIDQAEMEGLVEKGREVIDGVEEGPLRGASLTYRL
jgi:hypothetical protein